MNTWRAEKKRKTKFIYRSKSNRRQSNEFSSSFSISHEIRVSRSRRKIQIEASLKNTSWNQIARICVMANEDFLQFFFFSFLKLDARARVMPPFAYLRTFSAPLSLSICSCRRRGLRKINTAVAFMLVQLSCDVTRMSNVTHGHRIVKVFHTPWYMWMSAMVCKWIIVSGTVFFFFSLRVWVNDGVLLSLNI